MTNLIHDQTSSTATPSICDQNSFATNVQDISHDHFSLMTCLTPYVGQPMNYQCLIPGSGIYP